MHKFIFDSQAAHAWLDDHARAQLAPKLSAIHQDLLAKRCPGNDFLGWLDLPQTEQTLLDAVNAAAARIRQQAEILIAVGIGGSHLGGQAGLEMVRGNHYNDLTSETPKIIFAGHDLSLTTWQDIATMLQGHDWALNVIYKSGTTLEPALAFGFFQKLLRQQYGDNEANRRIYATTDSNRGLLHDQALANHWTRFVIPDDVGGRYSALTPVGLLPWAVAGLNLEEVFAGSRAATNDLQENSFANPAWQYAATRFLLLQQGKNVECLATYEPRLELLGRWWQQLFGESEGKTNHCIFPTCLNYTQDLHSLGQYLQQGQKFLFETTLWVEVIDADQNIALDDQAQTAMPHLRDRSIHFVQEQAMRATVTAHSQDNVPNLIFRLGQADEWHLGYTMYFFEFACALSALLLNVNPFDQPGVQAYKDELTRLLKS